MNRWENLIRVPSALSDRQSINVLFRLWSLTVNILTLKIVHLPSRLLVHLKVRNSIS